MYDFDRIINRRGTGSLKHDRRLPDGAGPNTISMWVADMDFAVLPEVRQALSKRVDHGIYGYSIPSPTYATAVAGWMKRRHDWEILPEWISTSPGVVPALKMIVRAFSSPGDAILVQRPVYYPFMRSIESNDRRVVNSPLHYCAGTGRYEIDFDDFERRIVEDNPRLFFLCNPHNPVGRVFTREELWRMGDLCLRHGLLIISDEIHHDFVYEGHTHLPFSKVDPRFAARALICTAPSKTFNLAGLHNSNIVIADPELKARFDREKIRSGMNDQNCFGTVACEAAYAYGDQWVEEVKSYLYGNYELIDSFLRTRLPMISVLRPEGLYLLWLDLRGLGMTNDEMKRFLLEEVGVWGDPGDMFGPEGEGFFRLNIACPRSVITELFERMERCVNNRFQRQETCRNLEE